MEVLYHLKEARKAGSGCVPTQRKRSAALSEGFVFGRSAMGTALEHRKGWKLLRQELSALRGRKGTSQKSLFLPPFSRTEGLNQQAKRETIGLWDAGLEAESSHSSCPPFL